MIRFAFRYRVAIFACLLWPASTPVRAQSGPLPKRAGEQRGFSWTETYEGSVDADGMVSDLASSVGYKFNDHFSIGFGVPYLFVQTSSSNTGAQSVSGLGNPSTSVAYAGKFWASDFGTGVTTTFPVASSAKGLSTGQVTFDWNNNFHRELEHFTPFFNVGLANSLSDSRFLHRPYVSLGNLAHFEAGPEFDIGDKLSLSASGYDILPWGPQQVFLRGKKSTVGPTKGGASLTRDDGLNVGLDYDLKRGVGLSTGYSYSAYNTASTFSFGIDLNFTSLIRKPQY